MDGFINSLKASFPSELLLILNNVAHDSAMPQTFPVLKVIPKNLGTNVNGQVSLLKVHEVLDFESIGKKIFV